MKNNVWIMNHYAGGMLFSKGGRHYSIAKYLKKNGYNPTVFCCNAKHNSESALFFNEDSLWSLHSAEEIGVPFIFVKGRAYMSNGKQRILNMIDFYRNVQVAAKEYAKLHGKPDIIYASSVHPFTLVAGIRLAKYYGVKCVCEVRDLWPETLVAYGMAGSRNPAVLFLRRLEKWIYKKADHLIFTMEGAYDYIVEQGWEKDVPRTKVHFINNGVDLEVFNYNKAHFRIQDPDLGDPSTFKVVYTGSIRKINNLGLLLDVAKQIELSNVKFLIWGDGDELPALRQRIAEENIDNVVFKGSVEKKYVPYIVSQADLNIAHNTSSPIFKYGTSQNKLFDYMAAGKPILCDYVSSYNPAVKTRAGVDLDNITAARISEEIARFASMDSVEYHAYCKNAGEALREYNFETLTNKLIEIMEAE